MQSARYEAWKYVDFRLSFDSKDANKNGFPSSIVRRVRPLFPIQRIFSDSSSFIRLSSRFFCLRFLLIFIQTLKFRSIWLCLWHAVSLRRCSLFRSTSCVRILQKPKKELSQKHQTKCDRLSNGCERVGMDVCARTNVRHTKCYLNRQTIYLISTYRIFLTLANVFWGFTK